MSTPQQLTLHVVTHVQDNGDGSTTTSLYNDRSELDAELAERYVEDGEPPLTCAEIENEEDPYENGYLVEAELPLEVDLTTGIVRLISPVSISAG